MPFGSFHGDVVTRWSREPAAEARVMWLVTTFSYIEPDGTSWKADKDRWVDGASVPEFLWSAIGSPFTGNYRRASVVHDIACQDKPLTSDRAHYMFYVAMRCDNTSERLAKTMYLAVKMFGPQWGITAAALPQTQENIRRFRQIIFAADIERLSVSDLDLLSQRIKDQADVGL